jgi:hypothetical protein
MIIKWFRRWRKESYRDLWYRLHGDDEHNGLEREFNFQRSMSRAWNLSYEYERKMRKEAEEELRKAGIAIPHEVRYDALVQRLAKENERQE